MQQDIREISHSSHSLLRRALTLAMGTLGSRVLGLIRDMAFAALFPKTITDAWGVAFRLPNVFRRLLGEGALSFAFVPVWTGLSIQEDGARKAVQLRDQFYVLLMLFLASLSLLGVLCAPTLVHLLVGDSFQAIPGKFELTVRMSQVMFSFIWLMTLYSYFFSLLNALGYFGWAAAAPMFFNVAMIAANFVPSSWQAWSGQALAWGVLVGGFLQMFWVAILLKQKKYFPLFRWNSSVDKSALQKVLWRIGPGFLGMALLQLMTLINTYHVSQLGEGMNTFLYLADRLLELPLSLISVSIGSVLLPTLSRFWSEKRGQDFAETLALNWRLNFFVAWPAATGLYALSDVLVEILFHRGQFSVQDALMTSSILKIYAWTLLGLSGAKILLPAFYAIHRPLVPALAAAVGLLSHLILGPWLMQYFSVQGLMLSMAVSASLNLLVLVFYLLRGKLILHLRPLVKNWWIVWLSCFCIYVICQLQPWLQSQFLKTPFFMIGHLWLAQFLSVLIVLIFSVVTYVGIGLLFSLEELQLLYQVVIRKKTAV